MAAQVNNRDNQLHPCRVVCSAGIGFIAATALTQTHPVAGIVFGGIYHVVTHLVEQLLSCLGESEIAKTTRIVIGILAGAGAAAAVLIFFGATMSLEAACLLTLSMAVSRFTQPLFCCVCVANCLGLVATRLSIT